MGVTLLLCKVPNHHILETLTPTDKMLGDLCSMKKIFKRFLSHNNIWWVR